MEKKPRLKIYNPITMNGLLIVNLVIAVICYILLAMYYPVMFYLFTLIIIIGFLLYVFYGPANTKTDQATQDTGTDQDQDISDSGQVAQDSTTTQNSANQKYKKIINGMDSVVLTFYIMLWVIYILIAIYFRNWFRNSMLTIFINLIVICGLLLIIFYNPIKKKFDSDIETAQKGYLKYVKQDFDSRDVFSDYIKSTMTTALNNKNEYYVIAFMILLYIPFIYYIVHLINNPNPTIDGVITFYAPVAFILVTIGLLIFSIVWFVNYGFNIWILILGVLSLLFSGRQLYKRVYQN